VDDCHCDYYITIIKYLFIYYYKLDIKIFLIFKKNKTWLFRSEIEGFNKRWFWILLHTMTQCIPCTISMDTYDRTLSVIWSKKLYWHSLKDELFFGSVWSILKNTSIVTCMGLMDDGWLMTLHKPSGVVACD
jgi:hypothetical protein